MTRRIAAVLLAAHGLIHLIGFVVPWGIAQVDGFPYRTTALGGAVELGAGGAQVVGILWLALAAAFVVAGVALWRNARWAPALAVALAGGSIAVCAMGLPEAAFGIVVDAAIIGLVAWPTLARRAPAAAR